MHLTRVLLSTTLTLACLAPGARGQCEGLPFPFADFALATDGERLVLGSPLVQVYQRTNSVPIGGASVHAPGTWQLVRELRAPIPQVGFGFGRSVALHGNTVAVGSLFEDLGALEDVGAVHVASIDGTLVQELRPTSPTADEYFGSRVALHGSTLAVASNMGFFEASAVRIFERVGTSWVEVQTIAPPTGPTTEGFGASLALSGDHLAIGASLADLGTVNTGAVHTFVRAGGTWQPSGVFAAADTDRHDRFATSLALSGTRLLVGAPTSGNGQAYLFEWSGAAWVEARTIVPPDERRFYDFGKAVALDQGRAAVSAEGRVYVFDEAADWNMVRRHYGGHSFGEDVDLGGDVVAVSESESPGSAPEAFLYPIEPLVVPFCYCDLPIACADADAGCRGYERRGVALSACGSTSVTRDDLVLSVERLPRPSSLVCFLMGSPGSGPAFGNGRRCLAAGSVVMFPPVPTSSGDPAFAGPGLAAYAQANFPPGSQILAGETRTFQAIYTDTQGPPRCPGGLQLTDFTGRNSTQALSVTFVP